MKMHHIGIIVADIEKERGAYLALGYEPCGSIVTDPVQSNRLLFIKNSVSGEMIELIEPIDEGSSVANRPKGYAHICYETESIDYCMALFKQKGLGVFFTEKIKAPGLGNRYVAFAMLRNKTILEFVELIGGEQ